MAEEIGDKVCPVERAGALDTSFRKIIHNPKKILKPHIKPGMSVLEIGCGPGFFTVEIAKQVTESGKVIAADLQEPMLDVIQKKITGTQYEDRVHLHKTQAESIGVSEKVDFVFAFYMVHEVPNQQKLFSEIKSLLKPDGRLLIFEPKFHVTRKDFSEMLRNLEDFNFKPIDKPQVFFSHSILLRN